MTSTGRTRPNCQAIAGLVFLGSGCWSVFSFWNGPAAFGLAAGAGASSAAPLVMPVSFETARCTFCLRRGGVVMAWVNAVQPGAEVRTSVTHEPIEGNTKLEDLSGGDSTAGWSWDRLLHDRVNRQIGLDRTDGPLCTAIGCQLISSPQRAAVAPQARSTVIARSGRWSSATPVRQSEPTTLHLRWTAAVGFAAAPRDVIHAFYVAGVPAQAAGDPGPLDRPFSSTPTREAATGCGIRNTAAAWFPPTRWMMVVQSETALPALAAPAARCRLQPGLSDAPGR